MSRSGRCGGLLCPVGKTFLPLAACLLLAASPGHAQTAAEAEALIRDAADQVMERLESEREALAEDPDHIYVLINELILPLFDFETISRWVLGKNWKQADSEQRAAFVDEFRILLVRTYARTLLEYSDQDVSYLPSSYKKSKPDRILVKTEIVQLDGPSIPIFYRMQYQDERWKIVDLSVDGVSMVSTYRNAFNETVRTSGLDGLIMQLTERNAGTAQRLEGA